MESAVTSPAAEAFLKICEARGGKFHRGLGDGSPQWAIAPIRSLITKSEHNRENTWLSY